MTKILDHKSKILEESRTLRYWKYQLLGWGLVSLYWAYIVYIKDHYSVFHTLINFIFDVLIGISLTQAYRLIIGKSSRKSFNTGSVTQLAVAIVILSIFFMFLVNLKWYVYWSSIKGHNPDFITSLFFWDPPFITGLRLMSIWVLAYHLYHYYEQQLALTAHNAELSVLAKQVQIDHLTNKLNPHFLFNSLNSVKSLISENPVKAKRSIDLLSDLLRSSLYIRSNLTTVQDELQLVYDYIELEKLRFEERLQLESSVDEEVLEYKIPVLCIQTLIENAVKHGIQNSIEGGVILLVIKKKIDLLEIVVQNPGQLTFEAGLQHRGFGLESLKKRLLLQYQKRAALELIEKPKGLVTGTLIIPLE